MDEGHTGARLARLQPPEKINREPIGLFLQTSIVGRRQQAEECGLRPALAPRFEMAELYVAQLVRQDGAEHGGRKAAKHSLRYADRERGAPAGVTELRCR